jgi:DNA-binding transcriptional LysR family regulator
VEVSIKEAYSAALVDEVSAGAIDFAIVPKALFPSGVRTRWLGRDQEMLVRRAGEAGPRHMQPVRLADLGALDLVLPARGNARRDAFDSYAQLHGVALGRVITMDAMIATLEFVAASGFATILPQTICFNDRDGAVRSVHPIAQPGFQVDYAVVEPARAALSAASALLLERIERHYHASQAVWARLGADISPADGRHEQVSLQVAEPPL